MLQPNPEDFETSRVRRDEEMSSLRDPASDDDPATNGPSANRQEVDRLEEHDTPSGCVLQILAVFGLVAAIVVLTAWYVSQTGQLPVTWADGPYGLPVWAPLVVLGSVTLLAAGIPSLVRFLGPDEPTFYQQIATNRRNGLFLTLAITSGLGLAAYAIAAMVSLRTSVGLLGAVVAVAIALVGAIVSLRSGDRIVLAVSTARPVDPALGGVLTDVVRELAIAADLPPPHLYLIEDEAPNAFSIGRDARRASLAVTTGLVAQLDRAELQGVVAHEMAHIRNEDTRYSLFVAVLVGATVLIADGFFKIITFPFQIAFRLRDDLAEADRPDRRHVSGRGSGGSWSLPRITSFGGGSSSGGGSGKGGGGAILVIVAVVIFVLLVVLVALVVKVLTPMFARLEQLAVSREREFLADATAVELGRNPGALERALVKVARSDEVLEAANRATAPLYFVNPIRAFERRAQGIYATHPPTVDRINRLRALQGLPPLTASMLGSEEDVD